MKTLQSLRYMSGPVLRCATTSRRSNLQCSTSGGGWVPDAHGQQRRAVMMYPISGAGFLVAEFNAGGGWKQTCSLTARDCSDGFAKEKLSKRRFRFRVHSQVGGAGSNSTLEDWTRKLPAKRKALYSHSLLCIEAWLQSLGFVQGKDDRAVWIIERPDWHAQLSLDITDVYIRYLKMGPGNLERDIERKFSYALSREDLENAILGGP